MGGARLRAGTRRPCARDLSRALSRSRSHHRQQGARREQSAGDRRTHVAAGPDQQQSRRLLDAVYGEASAPWKVSSTKPFYQHRKGGALSADIQRYDTTLDETLLYDSWVTIGAEDNYMNAVSGFIMEDALALFDQGNELVTNDGAWFVTPDKRQAAAGPSKRILLMQLTTSGDVEGLINLHGRTKTVMDSEGNPLGAPEAIKNEGLTFVCQRPR